MYGANNISIIRSQLCIFLQNILDLEHVINYLPENVRVHSEPPYNLQSLIHLTIRQYLRHKFLIS